jgi:hypothetical protein
VYYTILVILQQCSFYTSKSCCACHDIMLLLNVSDVATGCSLNYSALLWQCLCWNDTVLKRTAWYMTLEHSCFENVATDMFYIVHNIGTTPVYQYIKIQITLLLYLCCTFRVQFPLIMSQIVIIQLVKSTLGNRGCLIYNCVQEHIPKKYIHKACSHGYNHLSEYESSSLSAYVVQGCINLTHSSAMQ